MKGGKQVVEQGREKVSSEAEKRMHGQRVKESSKVQSDEQDVNQLSSYSIEWAAHAPTRGGMVASIKIPT